MKLSLIEEVFDFALNVLVINQFASAPAYNTGAGERHYYLASKLAASKIEFSIVSGGVNHLFEKDPVTNNLFNEESIEGGRLVWVRLRKYKPDSFIGRSFSWFEFLIKLYFLPVKKRLKPDLVLVSSMSLWSAIYGIYLKSRLGIPFILEIRDIWPLTPVEVGGISKNHPFIVLFKALEKYVYKRADHIISLMPRFDLHLNNTIRTKIPVSWIPNAIEPGLLKADANESSIFNSDRFSIVYAGALGYANSMECFIRAAELLHKKPIEFYIIGNGPQKQDLISLAFNSNNIRFIDKMSKGAVLNILKQADAGFISWMDLSLYQFGVSANKYNDYMLAGLPIISASNIPDDPVCIANCGFRVPAGNAEKIAEAIQKLSEMTQGERKLLGENGRNYVLKHNTYEVIAEKYETCLIKVVSRGKKC